MKQKILKFFGPIIFQFYRVYWRVFKPSHYGAKAVIERNGKFLVIKHAYGRKPWTFVGGSLNEGEEPLDAIIREAKEEIGLDLINIKEIGEVI